MTKKIIRLLLVLLLIGSPTYAQFVGFEDEVPHNFKCNNAKELALSTSFYKEGAKSLEWNFTPGSVIDVAREKPFYLKDENGITLWIYNYCCPLKLKMAKTSNPKPCKFGLRAYSFKK